MRLLAGLTVALLTVAALGCESRPRPEDAVAGLYRALATAQVRGAPSAAQLRLIAPYLSEDLRIGLRAARELQERERARSPDEKPPFADGDLFTSLFEGPTRFEIVADTASAGRHLLAVRFTYDGASPPVSWQDVAVVESEDGRWVVSDVRYGGGWDFAAQGSLRQALGSVGAAAGSRDGQ
jgi:hypothetical protein